MLLLVLCIITVILIYFYFTWNLDFWKKRNVPGPKPLPIVGNLLKSALLQCHSLYDYHEIAKKYQGSPYVGVFTMRSPQLMILDAELIKEVFIRKFNNFQDNEISDIFDKKSEPLFGRNPFALHADEWKEAREEMMPGLKHSRIQMMFPLIEDSSKQMLKHLKQLSKTEIIIEVNVRELAEKFTSNVTSSCIFGFDGKSFSINHEEAIFYKMGVQLMNATKRIIIFSFIASALPFLTQFYKLSYVPKTVYDFFRTLTKDATELRKEDKTERKDFLDHLLYLKEKKNISSIQMAAHALTFFFDGFGTSRLGLTMTLYEIAKSKKVQEQLRLEIQENIDEIVDFEKLTDLVYMEAVVTEGLRMYPPVPNLSKICTADTELPGLKDHKLNINKGMIVIMPLYSIHRNPEYYENPDEFCPERFMPENGGVKKYEDNCTFLTFGTGPRTCLGRKFGKTQIKIALVEILRNFEISVCSRTPKEAVFDPVKYIVQPVNGMWLQFKRLDSVNSN